MVNISILLGLSDNSGGYSSRQASVLSDSGGSMEWDSPMHCGVLPGGPADFNRHKYRYRTPVLSSNVSECSLDDLCSLAGSCLDQWEWDDAAYYITGKILFCSLKVNKSKFRFNFFSA